MEFTSQVASLFADLDNLQVARILYTHIVRYRHRNRNIGPQQFDDMLSARMNLATVLERAGSYDEARSVYEIVVRPVRLSNLAALLLGSLQRCRCLRNASGN
jgi:hypothetical protein